MELVATAKGHTLTIHLDRKTTNAPVDGAKIEVTGEGIPQSVAKETSKGTYEIEGEWIDVPGSKALTFVVTVGAEMDLLAGKLVIPSGGTGLDEIASAVRDKGVTTLWLTAGLFQVMVEEHLESLQGLRYLLAGGDVLSVPHVRRALEAM